MLLCSSPTLSSGNPPKQKQTFNLGSMDVLDDQGNHFHSLLQGGNHIAPVVAIDACLTKPIVVTVGEDRMLRVWSYLR